MTSREIVKAALYFRGPARLPVRFGSLGQDDFAWLPVKAAAGFKPAFPDEDEWGCGWVKSEVKNMGQVKYHPLARIADLPRSKYPDYGDDSRYTDVPAMLKQTAPADKYVIAGIFMVLFERMHTLYGFENTLTDLLTDRETLGRLADHVVEVHLNYVRNIQKRFGRQVHGFFMSDDWGTQQAAFVGLPLWMDFFYPRYKRLFDAMHEGGQDVLVHSCGRVNEIVEGYIRAGVNLVNLQQPRALGIRAMGERFRGRITFDSLADIQQTLPTNSPAEVDQDVAELGQWWMCPEGGFVFSDYGDDVAIGVKNAGIKLHMYQRFSELSERIYGQPLPPPVVPQA